MRKIFAMLICITLLFIPLSSVTAHPGKLDSNGGHNCSDASKKKGLCSGYHYHNGGSSNTPSTNDESVQKDQERQQQELVEKLKREEEQRKQEEQQRKEAEQKKLEEDKKINENQKNEIVVKQKEQEVNNKLKNSIKRNNNAPKYEPANVKIFVDQNKLSFEQEPVIIDGTTLVPLRAIFEPLGASVQWNQDLQAVTAEKDSIIIILQIGNQTAYKNYEPTSISVAPIIVNGSTMIPARFVAEAFGASVNWNDSTRTIIITENGTYDVVLHFPSTRYPETAAHIQAAIARGESAICTIDRAGADGNRDQSLKGIPTKDGYDRDEFPMAMCSEGGEGADVQYVKSSDNRGSGSWVGNQLEDYPNGTRVYFIIDDVAS